MAWNLIYTMCRIIYQDYKKDAEEAAPIPNSFMHQFRSDSTIHPSTHSTNHAAFRSANLSYTIDLFANEFFLCAM